MILNGIHIGEHSFEPGRVIDEIYERCVKPGLNFGFFGVLSILMLTNLKTKD